MSTDRTDRLVEEVRELLQAGDVGLYEFIWELNTLAPELSSTAKRECARVALRRLLDDGNVRLVRLLWARNDFEEPYSWAQLRDTDWDDPTDEPYVAITPD